MLSPANCNFRKMQSVSIEQETFFKRVQAMQVRLQEEKEGDFKSLVILNGKEDDRAIKVKISTLHIWLFGFEFPETLLVITPVSVSILASERKRITFTNFS